MPSVGPWTVIDGYCAARTLEGGDPEDPDQRVAFIEKTPRVQVRDAGVYDGRETVDCGGQLWVYGPRGRGGGNPEQDQTYGFYPKARAWCDKMLIALGYEVPDPVVTDDDGGKP